MHNKNPFQAANSLAAYRLDHFWDTWMQYEDWLQPEARAILWALYREMLRDFDVVNALYYLWGRNHSMRPRRLLIEAPKYITLTKPPKSVGVIAPQRWPILTIIG